MQKLDKIETIKLVFIPLIALFNGHLSASFHPQPCFYTVSTIVRASVIGLSLERLVCTGIPASLSLPVLTKHEPRGKLLDMIIYTIILFFISLYYH